jgi:hypothetical protein
MQMRSEYSDEFLRDLAGELIAKFLADGLDAGTVNSIVRNNYMHKLDYGSNLAVADDIVAILTESAIHVTVTPAIRVTID